MELKICHLYPEVLNLYGDRGNILCMKRRLEARGISLPHGIYTVEAATEAVSKLFQ